MSRKSTKIVDVSPWVDAYELMCNNLKQPCAPEFLEQFKAKLLGMSTTERNTLILGIKAKAPMYRAACLEIQTRLAKAKAKAIMAEITFDDFLA